MKRICVRGCADPRVGGSITAVEQAITGRYGAPYVQREFGSELAFVLDGPDGPLAGGEAPMWHGAIRVMRPLLRRPVTAYVLIGHDGGEDDAGCAAYDDEYAGGLSYPEERSLHWRNLNLARVRLQDEGRCWGHDLRVICLLDHHAGGLELVTSVDLAPADANIITADGVCDLIAA